MSLADLGLPLLRCLDPETAHRLAILGAPRRPRPAPGPDHLARGSPPASPASTCRTRSASPPASTRTPAPSPPSAAPASASSRSAPPPRGRSPATRARACSACRGPRRHQPLRLQQRRRRRHRRPSRRPAARRHRRPQPRRQQGQPRPRRRLRRGARLAGPFVDFATVNVSSPNTERLRELQGRAALAALLAGVMAANAGLARPVPVFLKIAPDLDDRALAELTEAALDGGVAGIVATNTTLARDGLTSRHAGEAGGLSGQPLFVPSTVVLAKLHAMTEGRLPLIGVGGVEHARAGLRQNPRRRLGRPVLHRPRLPRPRPRPAPPRRPRPPARPRRLRHRRRGGRHRPPRVAGRLKPPAPIGQCRGGRGGPARAPLGPLARRSDMEAQGRRPTAAGTEPANAGERRSERRFRASGVNGSVLPPARSRVNLRSRPLSYGRFMAAFHTRSIPAGGRGR